MFGNALKRLLGLDDEQQPRQLSVDQTRPLSGARPLQFRNLAPLRTLLGDRGSSQGNGDYHYNPQARGHNLSDMEPINGFSPQNRSYNPSVPNDISNEEEFPLQGMGSVRSRPLSVQPTRNKYPRIRF